MPDLTEDQIEELKGLDKSPQCPFCLIAEGKLPTNKIYEDSNFIAALEIRPANPGHIILFPKVHFITLQGMPLELANEFLATSSKIARAISKVADGVNILLSSGTSAGQLLEHLTINIIPRFKDDKLSFAWTPKKIDESQMQSLSDAISVAIEQTPQQEVKEEEPVDYDKLERQLPVRRI